MGARRRDSKLLGWLKALITGLMPKQRMEGDGGVMIGKVDGAVSQVTNNVTHHHFYAPLEVPDPAEAPTEPKGAGIATNEQREVLRMIRRLRNSEAVFSWMQRTFGTRMVIDLESRQLARVRKYVEAIERRTGRDTIQTRGAWKGKEKQL